MKIIFTRFVLIATIFFLHQPLNAGGSNYSFSEPSKLISFKASRIHNKVLLQWVMGENETTDQFEIEKSIDGKNFILAALIFGTDNPEKDSYEFSDKVKKEKTSYRLKIIGKNKQVAYSDVLVIKIK
jgi:hypothetical protein